MEDIIQQLRNDHQEFDKGSLEGYFGETPFDLLEKWYTEAVQRKQIEANAFVLSTVNEQLQVSSRVLYLKEITDQQFIFYTNYLSKKGGDLAHNPFASMLFFWPGLQRQLRIEGRVQKIEESISDAYFASRPRGSQLGAWASHQSEILDERATLEQRIEQYSQQFKETVPRPPHWGGYALTPHLIEFWQGRPSRLHDRIVYEKKETAWNVYRKNP